MVKRNFRESGITLIALVITIVILIILATVTINTVFGENGLIEQAQYAKDVSANATEEEYEGLNSVFENFSNILEEDENIPILAETKANAPVLTTNMTPIKWDGYTETTTTSDDEEWYSYERQSSTTESGGTSRWANAKNSDGSYFVWIPRFAYKITYYTDESKQTISEEETLYADIDIVFLEGTSNNYVDENGVAGVAQTIPANVGEDFTNSQKNGDKYTVHPAFTNGASNGYANGEWDREIAGFWIAKFEMSMETNGSHTETTSVDTGNILTSNSVKAVSKPGVSSWRYCYIGTFYTNGLNYESSSNSHAMKNSEWGAVAYLTYSEYGRNGTKLTINNSSTFITGNAGDTVDASSATGVTNAYNTDGGVLASTTGNIYGVYDMSGGAWEYTMAYITSGHANLTTYGSSFASTDSDEGNTSYRATSTKYATAYPQGISTTTEVGVETGYSYWNTIYGDAITEVSIGEDPANTTSCPTIYGDIIEFDKSSGTISSRVPFFIRGGVYGNGSGAGAFLAADNNGNDNNKSSRFVLVP